MERKGKVVLTDTPRLRLETVQLPHLAVDWHIGDVVEGGLHLGLLRRGRGLPLVGLLLLVLPRLPLFPGLVLVVQQQILRGEVDASAGVFIHMSVVFFIVEECKRKKEAGLNRRKDIPSY